MRPVVAKQKLERIRALMDSGDERGYDLINAFVTQKGPEALGYANRDQLAQAFRVDKRTILYWIRAGKQRAALTAAGIRIPNPSGLTLAEWSQAVNADALKAALESYDFPTAYRVVSGDRSALGASASLLSEGCEVVPVITLLKSLEVLGTTYGPYDLAEVADELFLALSALTAIVKNIAAEKGEAA